MGLDMYLAVSKYVSGYDFRPEQDRKDYSALLNLAGLNNSGLDLSGCPSGEIKINVAYWRKANAIHRWFVQNCAAGKDDCRPVCVARKQLEELFALCTEVLANPESAPSKLPSQSGFFFGSTEYDEGYFDDLRVTVKMLEGILTHPTFKSDDWDFEYQASW